MNPASPADGEPVDWELRPGGMLVQKRDEDGGASDFAGAGADDPVITIKVGHGSSLLEVPIPAMSTFGDLKKVLALKTVLEPQEQLLLFRGKHMMNEEFLHMVGVKDGSKLLLYRDPKIKEQKIAEMNGRQVTSKACEAVAQVRIEVDKLYEKVLVIEASVLGGSKVEDKEFVVLTELLMMQLLKLDTIEAEGEAKVQRKAEVRRIQNYVEILDALKVRNSIPYINNGKTVSVSTQWETFDYGMGSLAAPSPMAASTKITQDWEHFD